MVAFRASAAQQPVDPRRPAATWPDRSTPRWAARTVRAMAVGGLTTDHAAQLSTEQAAQLADMLPASFRAWSPRQRDDLRLPQERGPDRRTPAWDEHKVRAALAARPGRGASTDLPLSAGRSPCRSGWGSTG